jgi:hypothetical protein
MKTQIMSGAIAGVALLLAGGAVAQDAPVQEELLGGPPTAASWGIFSRGATRHYLIDVRSVTRSGDEATITIARVPTDKPAGDYSHTLDRFAVRCQARQSHVVSTTDAGPDGVPEEAYATDEPWDPISPGSFDSAIYEIACENSEPQPPSYPSVKAYIDAGRP